MSRRRILPCTDYWTPAKAVIGAPPEAVQGLGTPMTPRPDQIAVWQFRNATLGEIVALNGITEEFAFGECTAIVCAERIVAVEFPASGQLQVVGLRLIGLSRPNDFQCVAQHSPGDGCCPVDCRGMLQTGERFVVLDRPVRL